MPFNGYFVIAEKKSNLRKIRLEKTFWMIRDSSNTNITKPKTYETEEEAWKAVIVKPFNVSDYKSKGYYAIKINNNIPDKASGSINSDYVQKHIKSWFD
ncbi:putative orfan [Tupanvirus soda lake]|uniref:Orfan n=2 Tax=Tupanvirus TaxID=2094720 RepID=A0AC62ADU4_9VIRU|nr:putative orfan [Tupanvirus soda lake]QKU35960.1 putative orfan [Tupanvirus soda lake]